MEKHLAILGGTTPLGRAFVESWLSRHKRRALIYSRRALHLRTDFNHFNCNLIETPATSADYPLLEKANMAISFIHSPIGPIVSTCSADQARTRQQIFQRWVDNCRRRGIEDFFLVGSLNDRFQDRQTAERIEQARDLAAGQFERFLFVNLVEPILGSDLSQFLTSARLSAWRRKKTLGHIPKDRIQPLWVDDVADFLVKILLRPPKENEISIRGNTETSLFEWIAGLQDFWLDVQQDGAISVRQKIKRRLQSIVVGKNMPQFIKPVKDAEYTDDARAIMGRSFVDQWRQIAPYT